MKICDLGTIMNQKRPML